MSTRGNDDRRENFLKVPPGQLHDSKEGKVEGMNGKLNKNHLRLIPGLCLEDRTN